jgi:alpha-1,2-mannosyltransferase
MIVLGFAVLSAAVLAFFLALPHHIDLEVYRLGAEMWLAGGDLYGVLPPTSIGHLPFTYPPVAAVLFAPFALVPAAVANVGVTLLSVAALVLVMVMVLRAFDVWPTYVLVGGLLPLALLLEPVRMTLSFGQVNLLLMALVVLDCLARRPRWPRGVLVGLAAAVKLTPAAFVLFFLLRGDRKAAVTATVSFLGAAAVGFVLNPADSFRYWTSIVYHPDRIGGAEAVGNQSLSGLLARLGVDSGPAWLVLACVVVVVGALAVRRAVHPVDALVLNAFVVLLASPISWTHHWVWCVPALLAVWRIRPALAVGGVLLFVLATNRWWEGGPLAFTLGNGYVWCALLVLWSASRPFGRALSGERLTSVAVRGS